MQISEGNRIEALLRAHFWERYIHDARGIKESMYREFFVQSRALTIFTSLQLHHCIHLEGESITRRPNNRSLDVCMSKLGIAIRNRGEGASQCSVATRSKIIID